MSASAERTYGRWQPILENGLAEYLSFDGRKQFFDYMPVEDYYFAGVVALEAAKLRQVYTLDEADELLAEIGDQIDQAAGRGDRVLSELVFEIVSRIGLAQSQQKMPYDLVTKAILQHLDIHRNDAACELIHDKAFRHALGEPLAVGFQNWWQPFQEKFVLYIPPQPEPEDVEMPMFPTPTLAPPRRRRALKRAESLI